VRRNAVSVHRLLVTDNVVPSSPILVISSQHTSVASYC
jgi:hypothetical protein